MTSPAITHHPLPDISSVLLSRAQHGDSWEHKHLSSTIPCRKVSQGPQLPVSCWLPCCPPPAQMASSPPTPPWEQGIAALWLTGGLSITCKPPKSEHPHSGALLSRERGWGCAGILWVHPSYSSCQSALCDYPCPAAMSALSSGLSSDQLTLLKHQSELSGFQVTQTHHKLV